MPRLSDYAACGRTSCHGLTETMRNQTHALAIVAYIDELRQDEASAVEIINSNADFNGHKNNAVICTGPWTNYEDLRFEGDTLLDALRLAVEARRAKAA